MNTRLKITALTNLAPQGEHIWLATAPGPRFSLAPQALPVQPGWYRLRMRLRRLSGDSDARLIVSPADGSPPRELRLPVPLNGKLDHVLLLPFAVGALELQPFGGMGVAQLDRLHLIPLGRTMRLALMAGRVALHFLQFRGLGFLQRLALFPITPDVTLAPDGSVLETLYRLIKRRMVLRSMPAEDYDLWLEVNQCLLPPPQPQVRAGGAPRFSVMLPLGGDPAAARLSLESLAHQLFSDFECLLAHPPQLESLARELYEDYEWARPVPAAGGLGSALLAAGIAAARGDYLLCLLPGDQLAVRTLACYAEAAEQEPAPGVLYGDEDRLAPGGERRAPLFKPDWDPELLPGYNYLGPSFACARALACGVTLPEGLSLVAGLFHLALWAPHKAGAEGVAHVAQILLHRRSAVSSTEQDMEKLAVARLYCAMHRPGFRVLPGPHPGQRTLVPPTPDSWPLVSVIVPTRDCLQVLKPCLEGLLERTDYPNLEILVADNGSTDPETLAYLKDCQERRGVRVLRLDMPFNYSRLNNICVREAKGGVLVFLNNDIEVQQKGWLKVMVAQALRPEVGAVGALLLYPSGLVQHAGVVVGLGGSAGHPRRGTPPGERGSWIPLSCPRSVMAVTGACMAVRRKVFEEAGGFEERLAVAFNDVDLCLRIAQGGRRNIITPQASLLHYESYSRGPLKGKQQAKNFRQEKLFLRSRWGKTLQRDRYYNENLTLDVENCGLGLPIE